jgi:hypothetical protein
MEATPAPPFSQESTRLRYIVSPTYNQRIFRHPRSTQDGTPFFVRKTAVTPAEKNNYKKMGAVVFRGGLFHEGVFHALRIHKSFFAWSIKAMMALNSSKRIRICHTLILPMLFVVGLLVVEGLEDDVAELALGA